MCCLLLVAGCLLFNVRWVMRVLVVVCCVLFVVCCCAVFVNLGLVCVVCCLLVAVRC